MREDKGISYAVDKKQNNGSWQFTQLSQLPTQGINRCVVAGDAQSVRSYEGREKVGDIWKGLEALSVPDSALLGNVALFERTFFARV